MQPEKLTAFLFIASMLVLILCRKSSYGDVAQDMQEDHEAQHGGPDDDVVFAMFQACADDMAYETWKCSNINCRICE